MGKETETETTDNDETVETEESTDNQESESTEEEAEESTEEQSEESDSSQVDDEDVLDFSKALNVDKLPAELKATGKKMLGELTKTSQKLKKRFETLTEELSVKYGQAIIKGKTLDNLVNNEDFQLFLNDVEKGRKYGYSSKYRTNGDSKDDDEDEDGKEASGLTKAQVERMIEKAVRTSTKPILEDMNKKTLDWARKNLPNFSKYQADIVDVMSKHPTMSLEDAYNFASRDDAIKEARNGASKKDREDVDALRKKPRTEKGSSSKSDTLSPKDIKTLRGSIEWGVAQQKAGKT